ncbi:hypothetical protein RND71_028429 [Anisodus tanguticus]|uniref:Uncharacterized protein n=1 Tax=Anisodus tanguticus TaxID=243964 RepID=A0AAE1RKX4_9SOLA|nr:hypothetical protein RND71_028429 [Anisodus tanguticus]
MAQHGNGKLAQHGKPSSGQFTELKSWDWWIDGIMKDCIYHDGIMKDCIYHDGIMKECFSHSKRVIHDTAMVKATEGGKQKDQIQIHEEQTWNLFLGSRLKICVNEKEDQSPRPTTCDPSPDGTGRGRRPAYGKIFSKLPDDVLMRDPDVWLDKKQLMHSLLFIQV